VDVKIDWKGHRRFDGLSDSGFTQKLDASEANGGENSAARPMEYIAFGLVGCTAMDVISILQKKQQQVTDFQVKMHANRASEHPRVFTNAVIEYLVTGKDVNEAAVLRAIELSVEKYCPVYAMLSKAFPIELHYKIFDELHGLLKEGSYQRTLAGQ
jgi:putative redox protein